MFPNAPFHNNTVGSLVLTLHHMSPYAEHITNGYPFLYRPSPASFTISIHIRVWFRVNIACDHL